MESMALTREQRENELRKEDLIDALELSLQWFEEDAVCHSTNSLVVFTLWNTSLHFWDVLFSVSHGIMSELNFCWLLDLYASTYVCDPLSVLVCALLVVQARICVLRHARVCGREKGQS